MSVFEAFNQVGVTVLVATHDLPLISRLRHRIITLNEGRLAGAMAEWALQRDRPEKNGVEQRPGARNIVQPPPVAGKN